MTNLLGIGSKKPVLSVVEHHELASKGAFGLFDETLAKVTDANVDLDLDIEAIEQQIIAAQDQKTKLEAIKAKNSGLRDKIVKFFED